MKNKPQEAIDCFNQALTIAREIKDRRNEGAHLGNLEIVYKNHIEWLDGLKSIDADLVVFCGDLHNGSHREEAMPVTTALARLGPPVLIVPGNMDHKDVVPDLWSEAGFIMLHQTFVRHGDCGFLGLGGMVAKDPRRSRDPARYYHRDEEVYLALASAYPQISGTKCKIVVVHQPPWGAQDTLYNGQSSGSVCLASLRRRLSARPVAMRAYSRGSRREPHRLHKNR
jgi:Icc-related predicted phosphoesterase